MFTYNSVNSVIIHKQSDENSKSRENMSLSFSNVIHNPGFKSNAGIAHSIRKNVLYTNIAMKSFEIQ